MTPAQYERLGLLAKEIVDTDRQHAAVFAPKVLPIGILDWPHLGTVRQRRAELRARAHKTWGREAATA